MAIEMSNSTDTITSETPILIDETSSFIAFIGAIICAFLGSIPNFLTIVVISKRQSVRQHSLSPLLFLQGMQFNTQQFET